MAKKQNPETKKRLFLEQAEGAIHGLIATVKLWPHRFPQPEGALVASLVRLLEQTSAIAENIPNGRTGEQAANDFTVHVFGWQLANPGKRYPAWQHVAPSGLTERLGAWTGIASQRELWNCFGPMATLPNGDEGVSVTVRGLRILAAEDEQQRGAERIATEAVAA